SRAGAPSPTDPSAGASAGVPTTVVSLAFDNASADQYVVRSLLAARGMKATFFVNSGVVGRSVSSMNWGQLRSLADDGNEIGGKTINHVDLTATDAAEARRQVCEDRENLVRRGFSVGNFAYPYAAVNAAVEAVVKTCGYRSARRVGGIGCPNCPPALPIPPADPYNTGTVTLLGQTTSVADMQRVITNAEDNGGGWIQLVFFNICDGCSDSAVREADLTGLLDWLRPRSSRGTVVKTVHEALGGSIAGHAGRGSGSG